MLFSGSDEKGKREPIVPRPPIRNMTDFIVFAFVTIIVFILLSAAGTLVLSAIFRPDQDNTRLVTILADVTTSLISALVGFLAGKGQGRSDAEEAHKEQENRAKELHIEEIKATAGVQSKDGDK